MLHRLLQFATSVKTFMTRFLIGACLVGGAQSVYIGYLGNRDIPSIRYRQGGCPLADLFFVNPRGVITTNCVVDFEFVTCCIDNTTVIVQDYEEVNETMAEKFPGFGRSGDLPPPYTPVDQSQQYSPRQTLVVDAKSGVFHTGARFNEFSKPVIPPPPPGCAPNKYQQMQMEKGQLDVVFSDSGSTGAQQNKYGTF